MDDPNRAKLDAVVRAPLRTVGRYDILREIGRGGTGIVYTARQRDLDRLVALKELHAVHLSAPGVVERFMRESQLAGSVSHPNIVTVYEYFEEDGTPFIAMEHLPRGSLRPWVGTLSLAQLAGVLEGLLFGLAAVEPVHIVHRDLKPENVMVAADGRVQITDFGIAKASESTGLGGFATTMGVVAGTPAYMAPERALGHPIGPWTDLYSVGIMTYEQLAGSVPFHDTEEAMAILMRHVNDTIPDLTTSKPDLDPELVAWVERLLAKDPNARTPSAGQAWDEFEEIILRLLGPRWRRDAPLFLGGEAPSAPTPLIPKLFAGQSISLGAGLAGPVSGPLEDRSSTGVSGHSSLAVPVRAELESGLLAFGRAPSGFHRQLHPGAAAEKLAPSPEPEFRRSVPAPDEGLLAHGTTAARERPSGPSGLEVDGGRVARAMGGAVGRSTRVNVGRLRLLVGALVVAIAVGSGFALAPKGGGESPVRHEATAIAQPTRTYALTLGAALTKLNLVRREAGSELEHAKTATGQVAAAQRLARAHTQAATTIGAATSGELERRTNGALIAGLLRVALGYTGMAAADRREDRVRFDAARATVVSGTATLEAALARLERLGYRLSS